MYEVSWGRKSWRVEAENPVAAVELVGDEVAMESDAAGAAGCARGRAKVVAPAPGNTLTRGGRPAYQVQMPVSALGRDGESLSEPQYITCTVVDLSAPPYRSVAPRGGG